MEVILADCAGACYGVERALKLAQQEACGGGTAQTLGPLIHNPQVVAELEAQGVGVAADVDDIRADCVIIRSHGVTPEVRRQVKELGVRVVNATCPHVIRAQRAAEKLAAQTATVLVVGERSHPEVEGLTAYAREAGGNVLVVNSADDLPERFEEPVGIVVQTTQSRDKLDRIVARLREAGVDFVLEDTICSATARRQKSAAELAGHVDAMVVIGGRNSSNTTRLFEICRQHAPRAFHIEEPQDLQRGDFAGCARVGVTAGASTPDEQIRAVVDLLESW